MIRRGGWDFPGEDYPPPESITITGKEVRAGDRVRLQAPRVELPGERPGHIEQQGLRELYRIERVVLLIERRRMQMDDLLGHERTLPQKS